jgi:hypothetical protein
MKKVQIILTDFSKVSRLQPDWEETTGRADLEARKIYVEEKLPRKTIWSSRMVLEHEKAHFYIHDAGLKMTDAQEELLADWIGLVKTPDKYLQHSERLMKRWIKDGLKGERVILRIVQLLGIGDLGESWNTAKALWRAM